ncbi:MAG: helix-hairpin-helix domain-containing protein [Candidatus Kariarchaeaceae archaeon]|jgi:predicted flap endonuclease-1-like 5' DNA nuclease
MNSEETPNSEGVEDSIHANNSNEQTSSILGKKDSSVIPTEVGEDVTSDSALLMTEENEYPDLNEVESSDRDAPELTEEADVISDEEISHPTFALHRNSDFSKSYHEFIPGDLITLIVTGTGNWKISKAIMYDSRDQIRYQALSGGTSHNWTTRVQMTKTYGDWKFTVEGPLNIENEEFSEIIPFAIVKFLPEQVELIEEPEIAPEVVSEVDRFEIPVIEINGVGPAYASRLNDAGIFYFHQLLEITTLRAAEITNGTPVKAETWYAFVNDVLQNEKHELRRKYAPVLTIDGQPEFIPELNDNDPPEKIKGIGPATANKLITAGFSSVKSIADSTPNKMGKSLNMSISKVSSWISIAQEKLYGTISIEVEKKPDKVIDRIKSEEPVTVIKGIGAATFNKLDAIGFGTIKALAEAQIHKIVEQTNFSSTKLEGWISLAQTMLKQAKEPLKPVLIEKPKVKPEDPATEVKGIGPATYSKLKAAGFSTVSSISEASPEELATITKTSVSKTSAWISDAQIKLLDKAVGDVSKVKIAIETTQKDPLLRIRGVGPTYNRRFKESNITSLENFVELSLEKIMEIGKVNEVKAKQWLDDATKLTIIK